MASFSPFNKQYHDILWDQLYISEIALSNHIPQEKIDFFQSNNDVDDYIPVKTTFQDYGEHQRKYIWGDGIECLWENNTQRTCYFPWDNKCSAWNSAKLFSVSPIHKIVIKSTNNQQRNLGLKIQASIDHLNWDTLYILNSFDVKRMLKEPLHIYFFDNTKYLYIRIIQENSTCGYDIESISVFARENQSAILNTQNSIFYVLNGAMNINGLRYKAPFGLLKLPSNSFSITATREKDCKIFWITFDGNSATQLLKNANFDLDKPLFEIKNRTYLAELSNTVNELNEKLSNPEQEDNQFDLLSHFMKLMKMHALYNDVSFDLRTTQENYIML